MREFEQLWGNENSDRVFNDFNYKLYEAFGEQVRMRDLIIQTKDDGMIGLILETFKQVKN